MFYKKLRRTSLFTAHEAQAATQRGKGRPYLGGKVRWQSPVWSILPAHKVMRLKYEPDLAFHAPGN